MAEKKTEITKRMKEVDACVKAMNPYASIEEILELKTNAYIRINEEFHKALKSKSKTMTNAGSKRVQDDLIWIDAYDEILKRLRSKIKSSLV